MLLHGFVPCTVNSAASLQALQSNLNSRKLLWLQLSKEFPPTKIQFPDDWLAHNHQDKATQSVPAQYSASQTQEHVEWKQKRAKYFLAAVSD